MPAGALDSFGIDLLFRIPTLHHTSHLSEQMENSTFCTSYQTKILITAGISYTYTLHPIMPL